MPFYHKLGLLPHKRHIQFKNPNGKFYIYRHFLPPRVTKTENLGPALPKYVDFGPIRRCALSTLHADLGADPVSARILLPGNRDVLLGAARPTRSAVMVDTFNPFQKGLPLAFRSSRSVPGRALGKIGRFCSPNWQPVCAPSTWTSAPQAVDGDKINLAALKPAGRLAGEAMRV